MRHLFCFVLMCLLAACQHGPAKNQNQNHNQNETKETAANPITATAVKPYSLLKLSDWQLLPQLATQDFSQAWPAWLQSCAGLKNKPQWRSVCEAATQVNIERAEEVSAYFKAHFEVYQATQEDGAESGLITGYYQPELNGSLQKTALFSYPIYGVPQDLITVELSDIYPDFKYKRVRGRLVGKQLLPYYTRAEIDVPNSPIAGNEIAWVDDPMALFFLQIQGSGIIKLPDGRALAVGYADQNGHAYQSIGKILIARGDLTKDQASMQGIKTWAAKNPQKVQALLNENASYVFFRFLPSDLSGPLGALGVPLTAEQSIAVDPKWIPLGAPVFLATTYPNSAKPLQKLMFAQDTGGAIKGGVRADIFWGAGDAAGNLAGKMKQTGKMWVLLPKGFEFAQ